MSINIDDTLGNVRLKITTDPDHFADYDLSLWEKRGTKWVEIPGAITPPDGDTAAEPTHKIDVSPAQLTGRLLYLEARVNSITPKPLALELNIVVWQPSSAKVSYRVASNTPVPPGKTRKLTAEYFFEVP